MTPMQPGRTPPRRLVWIDWLKVLVVLGVFAYHAAQPFVATTWIITNPERSLLLGAFAGFGYLTGMPLMFLLAGAASWLALGQRGIGRYLWLRVQRLAVPLVLGIALLSPFQAWIGALTRGSHQSLPAYGLQFFGQMRLYPTPRWLGDYGYHLWFLGFLFLYAVISIPALGWMRRAPGQAGIGRLAALIERPLGLWWPLLPLVASQLLLRASFPSYRDWADFGLWLIFFLIGVMMVADHRILSAMAERGLRLLVPALVLATAFIPIATSGAIWQLEGSPRYDLAGFGYVALRTAVAWCWVVVAVAIGVRWFDHGERVVRPAAQIVLPFYVLHHPAIVIVAAVVVGWPAGVWPKYAAILIGSLGLTLLLCEAVRRIPALRGIFGIPGSRSAAMAEAAM